MFICRQGRRTERHLFALGARFALCENLPHAEGLAKDI
jgi:hypothetical protein